MADTFSVLLRKSVDSFKGLFKPFLVLSLIIAVLQLPLRMVISDPQRMIGAGMEGLPMFILLIVIFGLISIIVSVISYSAMMIMAVRGETSVQKAFSEGLGLIWPLIVIGFWTMVRTYVWIGLLLLLGLGGMTVMQQGEPSTLVSLLMGLTLLVTIGLSFALGPVYIPAPFIYVKARGKMTPLQAVDACYGYANGYWGKIVGNMILLSLVLMPVSLAVGIVVGIVGAGSIVLSANGQGTQGMLGFGLITQLIQTLVGGVMQGFQMLFLSHLTDTIVAHPSKKAIAKA